MGTTNKSRTFGSSLTLKLALSLLLTVIIISGYGGMCSYLHNQSSDETGSSSAKSVSFTPTIGDKSTDEMLLLTFVVTATDTDGRPLTYSASGLPAGASFSPSTHTFSWTPSYSQGNSRPTKYPNVKFRATNNIGLYAE